MFSRHTRLHLSTLFTALCALILASCGTSGSNSFNFECSLDTGQLFSGGVSRDGIPALTDPTLVGPGDINYLDDDSRIIGLIVNGDPIAVPHNILWHHEIANFNFEGGTQLAVTFCPLTGSSLTFDRAAVGGGEFGVSGLLFQSNLTMFDRTNNESLWPQMNRAAGCGPRDGAQLEMVASIEMTWSRWVELHPDTKVISANTGFTRNYTPRGYPYFSYNSPNNPEVYVPLALDTSRPPKEILLGIPDGEGGIGFPFFELDNGEPVRVITETVRGEDFVLFWDAAAEGAMAYRPSADGQPLTFEVREGRIFDVETESEWRIDGFATSGPLAGLRLEPIAEAYTAFWFAWKLFQPRTRIWEDAS